MKSHLIVIASVVLLSACSSSKKVGSADSGDFKLKFLDEYVVPYGGEFKGTALGGLSGIDYDAKQDIYYLVCDDRSDKNPARFYTAKIILGNKGIDSVQFVDMFPFLDEQGKTYPNRKTDSLRTPDPESIRFNTKKNELVWSSEGDRIPRVNILVDPAIYSIDLNGRYKNQYELPTNLHMRLTEKGPRQNGVFEGLSFTSDYKYLFVSVEEPLFEDGPRTGSGDSSAWIRILKFDEATRKQVAQYAYRVEPVAYPPDPPGGFRINGVSEILSIGPNKLLVMERSFSTGRASNTIRLYEADLSQATDISTTTSLLSNPPAAPVSKKLILNMDNLGRYIDNVEGVTFGPTLANGHRSLILVSDDNFSADEKIQFFLFEIL